MVAAAVAARIGSSRITNVSGIGYGISRRSPTIEHTTESVRTAVGDLPEPPVGPIVAERGEFYEESAATMGVWLDREFKYVESIAERKTVNAAHHAAYAARGLLL